jgi:hypothetical protein
MAAGTGQQEKPPGLSYLTSRDGRRAILHLCYSSCAPDPLQPSRPCGQPMITDRALVNVAIALPPGRRHTAAAGPW